MVEIDYAVCGDIGTITFANPPSNCFTDPVFADPDELKEVFDDPRIKAIIITGAGRHFSAGADVVALRKQAQDPAAFQSRVSRGKALLDMIRFAPLPVCALIHGSCLGAGLELALACHFRFAATTAMFGFPESTIGLMPGLGGTQAGGDILKKPVLVELLLSGKMIGAPEARRAGLIDQVENRPVLESKAQAFLERLVAGKERFLVEAIMTSVANGKRLPRDEALARETELFCQVAARLQKEQS